MFKFGFVSDEFWLTSLKLQAATQTKCQMPTKIKVVSIRVKLKRKWYCSREDALIERIIELS